MARIDTVFGFKDEVSRQLNMVISAMNTLNQTANAMKTQLTAMNEAIKQTAVSSENTANKVGGLNTKLLNINSAVKVYRTMKGAVDSLGQSVAECSSLYNFQIEQETKLETVMRTHMKATDAQIQMIKNFASAEQKAGIYGDEMILNGVQELATYIDNVDTLKDLIPIMNSMVAQKAGYGASANTIMQMATGLGKVMQGQTGGLSKQGYKFSDEEEKILKTGTEIQKIAILQQTVIGGFGDMNRALAATPMGQIQQLKNEIGDMQEEIGRAMIPFSQLFSLSTMQWKVTFYKTIASGLDFMASHIAQVKIALGGLSAAILTVAAAYGILHAAQIKSIALAIKKTAVEIAGFIATHAALFATIGIILAVIAAITLLLIHAQKTFPAIGGFIGGVAGVAKEVGAQIKYYFGSAIEGIVNGFLMMKNTVVSAFLSMFDFLLSGVEKVASAMDSVFGTSMATNISGFRNALAEMKNQEQAKFTLGWEDNRQEFGNSWNSGWDSGAKMGAEIAEKMNKSLEGMFGKFKSPIGGNSNLDKLSFGSNGALKTTDSGIIEISEDYRELLSKTATRRFNAHFRNVAPEIHLGGIVINENADADKVIDMLTETVERLSGTDLEAS